VWWLFALAKSNIKPTKKKKNQTTTRSAEGAIVWVASGANNSGSSG
jgi:hypothetical protein